MRFDKDDFMRGEPSLDGLFRRLLTMVAAGIEVPFGTLDQQLCRGEIGLRLGELNFGKFVGFRAHSR